MNTVGQHRGGDGGHDLQCQFVVVHVQLILFPLLLTQYWVVDCHVAAVLLDA